MMNDSKFHVLHRTQLTASTSIEMNEIGFMGSGCVLLKALT